MQSELVFLGIKIIILLCISPFFGYLFMHLGENFEKAWKSNDRKKKWLAMSALFCILASLAGWLK